MLKVENISFSYTEVPILKSVSFDAKVGEHISIVGESGSGKTTLLKLLYGVYDLKQGNIFWKNKSILGPKFNLLVGHEYMKYVSQEFELVPYFTVEETVGKFLILVVDRSKGFLLPQLWPRNLKSFFWMNLLLI